MSADKREITLFHPPALPTTHVQATTLWGRAFDWLIAKRELSLGQFSSLVGKARNEVRYWRLGGASVKKDFGPGIGVVNEVLPKIGSSWAEWAGIVTQLNIIDRIEKGEPFDQSGHRIPEDLPISAVVAVPEEMTVCSREQGGVGIAWMKAMPEWTIARPSQGEAAQAMGVLAANLVTLASSFGVIVSGEARQSPAGTDQKDGHTNTLELK